MSVAVSDSSIDSIEKVEQSPKDMTKRKSYYNDQTVNPNQISDAAVALVDSVIDVAGADDDFRKSNVFPVYSVRSKSVKTEYIGQA